MSIARLTSSIAALLALLASACGNDAQPPPKTCDAVCQDQVAARALREMLKLGYNLTLQGKPVGPQDATTPCLHGGMAHISGVASSVAEQGATELDLVYELDRCTYLRRDDEPEQNYDVSISGSVHETGILAVQPTATTALIFESEALSLEGTLFDPEVSYSASDCAVGLGQDGNHLSGSWCGRKTGLDL